MTVANAIKDYIAIKGKIFIPGNSYYGIFFILLNNKNKSVENSNAVFTIYSDIHQIEINAPWNRFEQKIEDTMYGENVSHAITSSVNTKLKGDISRSELVAELTDYAVSDSRDKMHTIIEHLFKRSTMNNNIVVEEAFEHITESELREGRIRQPDAIKESTPEPQIPLLKTKLSISPVKGKSIHLLKRGEQIMVVPVKGMPRENEFITKYKLEKENGNMIPVKGTILSIKPASKGYQLTVGIGSDFQSVIVEEEPVLVRVFNSSTDQDLIGDSSSTQPQVKAGTGSQFTTDTKRPQDTQKRASGIIPLLTGLAILGLGMVAAYLFFLG